MFSFLRTCLQSGIELEPDYGMAWEEAAALAVEGADAIYARGIIPIYSPNPNPNHEALQSDIDPIVAVSHFYVPMPCLIL